MTIYRVQHQKNYTCVNNFICKDNRISWKAKGIWLYAFSRPDDWEFHLNDLINHSTDGRDSVRVGLKELEDAGYLRKTQHRDHQNRFQHSEWEFYETPEEIKEIIPYTENPLTGIPLTENRPILSTESNQVLKTTTGQTPGVVFYTCIKDLEMSEDDKNELMKFPEDRILLAIEYSKTIEIKTTLIQVLIWHCKRKEAPVNEKPIRSKICDIFKSGEMYNHIEICYDDKCISFRHELGNYPKELKWNETDFQEKFEEFIKKYKLIEFWK